MLLSDSSHGVRRTNNTLYGLQLRCTYRQLRQWIPHKQPQKLVIGQFMDAQCFDYEKFVKVTLENKSQNGLLSRSFSSTIPQRLAQWYKQFFWTDRSCEGKDRRGGV